MDFESLVERRIREATERGDFDNLPSAGKPLDLKDLGDPDWWLKQYLRREKIDPSALVPPTLALRREADRFPGSLTDLATPDQVRAVLEDFNRRVRADWLRPAVGPSLPFPARQVDVEAMLARWRELTGYPDREPAPSPRPGSGPVDAPVDSPDGSPVTAQVADRRDGRPRHRWARLRRLLRR